MEAIIGAAIAIALYKFAPPMLRSLHTKWQRRHIYEECCKCGKRILARKAVELTETFDNDREVLGSLYSPGSGTSISATYCKKDAKALA